LLREKLAGGAADLHLLTKSGDGEAEMSSTKHECCSRNGSNARNLRAAKLGEVRRSSGGSSPSGERKR
jgi:hypothetical protein